MATRAGCLPRGYSKGEAVLQYGLPRSYPPVLEEESSARFALPLNPDVACNEVDSADGVLCVEDRQIEVGGGKIHIRCCRPVVVGDPDKNFPLLVWLHGGGARANSHSKSYSHQ